MATTTTHEAVSARPPLWRDAAVLKWVSQVGLLIVVVSAMVFMATQAGSNLEARDIPTGFDFIGDSVGIQIFEGIDTRPDTGGRALWAGMVNTLRISGAGIVIATILACSSDWPDCRATG